MTPLAKAVVALLAIGGSAAAQPDDDGVMLVPDHCMVHVPDAPGSPIYWDRVMSLAACVQDTPVSAVGARSELAPMIKEQVDALVPSMVLYSNVLARGPAKARFRAAYHVGLAAVALLTRARRSIVVTGAHAAPRELLLRDTLELQLSPIKQMAQSAFATALQGAQLMPEVADDPVGRNMLRSATQLLRALGSTRIADPKMASR